SGSLPAEHRAKHLIPPRLTADFGRPRESRLCLVRHHSWASSPLGCAAPVLPVRPLAHAIHHTPCPSLVNNVRSTPPNASTKTHRETPAAAPAIETAGGSPRGAQHTRWAASAAFSGSSPRPPGPPGAVGGVDGVEISDAPVPPIYRRLVPASSPKSG